MSENENFILTSPSMKYRETAISYVEEFKASGENMDGFGIDSDITSEYDSYGSWISWLYSKDTEVKEGDVSSFTFFYIRESDNELIGSVNIRNGGPLAEKYGNIGYAIRPSLRGRGYGSELVEAAICLCHFIGIESLTAVCRKDNLPSIKVLENNGFEKIDLATEDDNYRFERKL